MDADPREPVTHARPEAPPTPAGHDVNAALRAEALRQLRWQQRTWQRHLALHPPGTPCLIPSVERAGLTTGLVLLQEAGEDVPAWLSQRRSLVRTAHAASGTAARVRLVPLLATVTRVLEWFDPE